MDQCKTELQIDSTSYIYYCLEEHQNGISHTFSILNEDIEKIKNLADRLAALEQAAREYLMVTSDIADFIHQTDKRNTLARLLGEKEIE